MDEDQDKNNLDQIRNVTSYINICFAVLGIIGNLTCSRVMITQPLKHISCTVFFFFLGISDSIVLVIMMIEDISVHTPSLSSEDILYGGNEWRCRFGTYGLETCRTASSWLVIALVAELYLATNKPIKAKTVYKRWRSFRVSIYITLVACAGSLPLLVINTSDGEKCTPQYRIFVDIYSSIIMRPIVIFIFPLFLCIFCLVKIFKTLTSNDNSVIEQQASGSYTDDRVLEELFRHGYQAKTGIFAVALIFIISVVPSIILDIVYTINKYAPEHFINWKWESASLIARCLLLANYSIKFYVVLVVENDFKQALSYVSTCGLFNYNKSDGYGTQNFHDLATISNGFNHDNRKNNYVSRKLQNFTQSSKLGRNTAQYDKYKRGKFRDNGVF